MGSPNERKRTHWFDGDQTNLDVEGLNLGEFPLAVLARNVPADKKVITFSDSVYDKQAREWLHRTLRISANVDTSLPNYLDQDVLVALNVLTWRKNGFQQPVVEFSIYELLKTMRLGTDGRSVQRVVTSLDNWQGVRFKWSHWWTGDTWTNPKATVLIQDYDLTRTPQSGRRSPERPQVFAWSRLYFDAMQPGKRKWFNSDFYFSLSTPTARRLYRFLDKRLHERVSYDRPIADFCVNKLGLADRRKPSQYPDKVNGAYDELVEEGFLADLPREKRYSRGKDGTLRVNFRRGRGRTKTVSIPTRTSKERSPLEERLIERGMTPNTATKWANQKPDECERQIEHFDFKLATGWKPTSSGGGYLSRAISEEFAPPTDFKSKADREEAAKKASAKKLVEYQQKQQQAKQAELERAIRRIKCERFALAASELTAEQVRSMEEAANDKTDQFSRQSLHRDRKSDTFGFVRFDLWDQVIMPKLDSTWAETDWSVEVQRESAGQGTT